MRAVPGAPQPLVERFTRPETLWTRRAVLARPCPVPAEPGIYGWYFRQVPCEVDVSGCVEVGAARLLYLGISPAAPRGNGRPARENLRTRIRTHYRGNAAGSTLRLTLGVLLGLELRRQGSRLTFADDEATLSAWMDANALVAWVPHPAPWEVERELIERFDLPLNLRGNEQHPYYAKLRALRRAARERARLAGPGVGANPAP